MNTSSPAYRAVDARPGRNVHIDLVRFVAIIAVVFAHASVKTLDNSIFEWLDMFNSGPLLFFICSGALILPVKRPCEFVKRRLIKLLPAFVVWSVVYALLDYYVIGGAEVSLSRRLTYMFFVPTWGEGWFVLALIGLYLIAVFLSPWLEGASRRSVEVFLGLWGIAGFLPFVQVHLPLIDVSNPVAPFYNYFGYMLVGYYLMRWPLGERTKRARVAFWCVVIALGLLYPLRMYPTALRWGFSDIFTSCISLNVMACATAGYALLMMLPAPRGVVARFVTSVSRHTYGIYLLHSVFTRYVVTWLFPGASLWLTIPAVLLVSWVLTLAANGILRLIGGAFRRVRRA